MISAPSLCSKEYNPLFSESVIIVPVKTENANGEKSEAEAEQARIDTIRKIVEDVYQPTIDAQNRRIAELSREVEAVRSQNRKLLDENDRLRDTLREIRPDIIIPSRRSEAASRQPRGEGGKFIKKEDAE